MERAWTCQPVITMSNLWTCVCAECKHDISLGLVHAWRLWSEAKPFCKCNLDVVKQRWVREFLMTAVCSPEWLNNPRNIKASFVMTQQNKPFDCRHARDCPYEKRVVFWSMYLFIFTFKIFFPDYLIELVIDRNPSIWVGSDIWQTIVSLIWTHNSGESISSSEYRPLYQLSFEWVANCSSLSKWNV